MTSTPGILYVCATPIGNLDDVSLRLLATLREVDLIVAEDTRHTQRLLARHEIQAPLASCHEHTHPDKIRALAQRLAEGQNMALVTMPAHRASAILARRSCWPLLKSGATVSPIPGPCALAAALSISGFDAQRFRFWVSCRASRVAGAVP
jgi:16S rRNA (cytidine1402-2'-O)-methyltransferase